MPKSLRKYRPLLILILLLVLVKISAAEPATGNATDKTPPPTVDAVETHTHGGEEPTGEIELAPAVESFVVILIIVFIVTVIANYYRLPYTLILVISGLVVGYFPILKGFNMSHDLVFFLFLPPLLFEGAINLNLEHLKSNLVPITIYAVLGVIFGTIATGLMVTGGEIIIHAEFGLLLALLFGALISATDPVSVLGIFKHYRAPKKLASILEGESLFNDGVAVVCFTIILKLAQPGSEGVVWTEAITQFTLMVVGGLLLGVAVGFVASWFTKQIDDHLIEITLSTIVAFGTYLLAEQLGLSGVIAVVAAGLVVGNYGFVVGMSPTTRVSLLTFWEYIGFLINALVFLLIGIQVKIGVLWEHRLGVLIAISAVLISRFVVVYLLAPVIGKLDQPLSGKYKFIIWWGGLRGALSMALALSLPKGLDFREEILAMTFGVAIFSLLVQGLSIGKLLKRFKLIGGSASEDVYEELLGRIALNLTAADRLKQLADEKAIIPEMGRTIADEFTQRAREAEEEIETLRREKQDVLGRLETEARLQALYAGKASLMSLYQQGSLSKEVYANLVREVNHEIDQLKHR